MKIEKYTKSSSNKYKVLIDGENYTLYDDVIIKYNLLMKKEITENELNEIILFNNSLLGYYQSVKYISTKMRSEKEIRDFLKRKDIDEDNINKTIDKLKNNRLLNDELYVKAYINDQVNITNNGINKIRNNLIKMNIDYSLIDDYLNTIDNNIFIEKIDHYIEKKIKCNHTSSGYMLKMKIVNELINLGYDKDDIMQEITKYDIIDTDIYKREYEKTKKALEKKYSGYELEMKIKEKLYRKGFRIGE